MNKNYTFTEFVDIIKMLRSENGCPWDKIQTHESLKKCLLEESYEVIDAIDNKDSENLKEELGDLLMQVVFHSNLEEENNNFTIQDVINEISNKMIHRHPHIFSNVTVKSADDVLKNWEKIKLQEKNMETNEDIIKSVPKALPALMRAEKTIRKAKNIGYENPDSDTLKKALNDLISSNNVVTEDTIGQILLLTVKMSSNYKINPELALTKSLETFINNLIQ